MIRLRHYLPDVKVKQQLELCALLATGFLIAKYCAKWGRIFKWLSQHAFGGF